jgi:hypothetical protein
MPPAVLMLRTAGINLYATQLNAASSVFVAMGLPGYEPSQGSTLRARAALDLVRRGPLCLSLLLTAHR